MNASTTIIELGEWKPFAAPLHYAVNSREVDLPSMMSAASFRAVDQTLHELGQDINEKIAKILSEGNEKGIKLDSLELRWVNILDQINNPDGARGFYRIVAIGTKQIS